MKKIGENFPQSYSKFLGFVVFLTAHIITGLGVRVLGALLIQPVALHGSPTHPVVLDHHHVSCPPRVKAHPKKTGLKVK